MATKKVTKICVDQTSNNSAKERGGRVVDIVLSGTGTGLVIPN